MKARSRLTTLLAVSVLMFGAAALPASADVIVDGTEDVAAPVVVSLTLSPGNADTASGPATIVLTAHVTDDLSGVQGVFASLSDPEERQLVGGELRLLTGTPLDGVYQGTITLPQYSRTGAWGSRLCVSDVTSNTRCLDSTQTAIISAPSTVEVTGMPDLEAPQAVTMGFSPGVIDTSTGPATVTITAHVSDDVSGVQGVFVSLWSPGDLQFAQAELHLIAGSTLDGTYSGSLTVPQFARTGAWTSRLCISDLASNTRCLDQTETAAISDPNSVTVAGGADVLAPVALSMSFLPGSVDTSSGPANVVASVHVTDDVSGVQGVFVSLWSPGDLQYAQTELQLSEGSNLDGTYSGILTIPQFSRAGAWTSRLCISDLVSNTRCLDQTETAAISDPATVGVTSDSTPPVVTGSADRPPNSAGWYNAPVTVAWSASDPDSPASTPAPVIMSGEGAGQIATSSPSCDSSNNCAVGSYGPVSIDLTKPHLTIAGIQEGDKYTLGAVPAASCTASDALSGIDGSCTVTVTGGNINGVGTFIATATAADTAGNSAAVSVAYRVVYPWHGFEQPINDTAHQIDQSVSVFKAGSTVPVKFHLTNAAGQPISPVGAPTWIAPSRGSTTALPVDESAYPDPGHSGSAYQRSGGTWSYNWKTSKTGSGFYWRIGVRLDDGEVHYTNIALR